MEYKIKEDNVKKCWEYRRDIKCEGIYLYYPMSRMHGILGQFIQFLGASLPAHSHILHRVKAFVTLSINSSIADNISIYPHCIMSVHYIISTHTCSQLFICFYSFPPFIYPASLRTSPILLL